MRILEDISKDIDLKEGYLVLVDKPLDWTSFDVVKKLRGTMCRFLGIKKLKVGHAGTLDPLATGLLIIAVGKYTKKLHHLQNLEKVYTGQMKFGFWTDTYDAEGKEKPGDRSVDTLTFEEVEREKDHFVGDIQQVPPLYSAVKIKGQKAYSIARRGKTVELKARPVRIDYWNLVGKNWPTVEFEVSCSKGTYIRSLAHDLGQKVGTGAYLTALRRESIGEYHLRHAWTLTDLVEKLEELTVDNRDSAPQDVT